MCILQYCYLIDYTNYFTIAAHAILAQHKNKKNSKQKEKKRKKRKKKKENKKKARLKKSRIRNVIDMIEYLTLEKRKR